MNIIEKDTTKLVPAKDREILNGGQYYPKNIATISAISKAKLSGTQICVYDLICCLYSTEKSYAFPSYETMAEILEIDKRTVRLSIKKLEEVGLIKITNRRNKYGGDISNSYVPYCINMNYKSTNETCDILEVDSIIIEEGVNKYSSGEGSNDHPGDDETTTQIEYRNIKIKEKIGNEILEDTKANSPFPFPFPPPFPYGVPNLQAINSKINKSPIRPENVKHDIATKEYQKDLVYRNAPEYCQKIFDHINKVNEANGISTRSWRMNDKDLKNIKNACQYVEPKCVMDHIDQLAKDTKDWKNESRGVSYFLKKYIGIDYSSCGILV